MELTEPVKHFHKLGGCCVLSPYRKFGFARTGTTLRELTDPAVQQVGKTAHLLVLSVIVIVLFVNAPPRA